MPYQLAVPGPDQYSDTCESAVVYELELHPGDVIIVATDGVLDNLWDKDMAKLVHQFLGVRYICWHHVIFLLLCIKVIACITGPELYILGSNRVAHLSRD